VLPWYLQLPAGLGRWRVTAYWLNGFPGWGEALKAPALLAWSFVSGNGYWGYSAWGTYLALALFGLVLVLLCRALFMRPTPSRSRLLYLWLFAACAGPVAFDVLGNTCTSLIPRYALAGMPAAFLLAGFGLHRLRRGYRIAAVALIMLAWSPGISKILHSRSRAWEPYRQVGNCLEQGKRPGDVVIVHSIPSGVLGVARYVSADTRMASWVGQLRRRRVPDDIEAFIAGRQRAILVQIHAVNEPAPEESWLRENARCLSEVREENARLLFFAPLVGDRFARSAPRLSRF
jgi:hypothetical protein